MLGTVSDRSRIVNDVSSASNFSHILDCHFSWQAQYLVVGQSAVAPRIVNSVSYKYVTRINDEGDFSWQAQYLVRLVNDSCCSAHCK